MPLSYPNHLAELQKRLTEIEQALQYGFHNKELLTQAFTHRSYLNEQRQAGPLPSNERLEFLGDAILNALVGRFLFENFPQLDEGELSGLRAQIVDAGTCAQNLVHLGLESALLMGKGQRMDSNLQSLQADLFEAILGAIYLDGGWPAVERFFWDHFTLSVRAICENPQRNWKAELQDSVQKKLQITPSYCVLKEVGPDHNKAFDVGVFVGATMIATGSGNSKKQAQQSAARQALQAIEENVDLWRSLIQTTKESPCHEL